MSAQPKTFSRRLAGMVHLQLRFVTMTGLLIRVPIHAQVYKIGGADQYPMTVRRRYRIDGQEQELEVPYVPGSSFKGRMRSLLELALGLKLYSTDQKIWQHVRNLRAMHTEFVDDVLNRCVVDELFGWAAANYTQIAEVAGDKADRVFSLLAPTRLLVGDFTPPDDYVAKIGARSIADFLEEKSENRIDRVTSAADPRQIVRVKPGVEFEGELTILLFDIDRDMVPKYLQVLATGLRLLESTYLGASGSRGYGRIKFTKISVSAERVAVRDGVPSLEKVKVAGRDKAEFNNLDEFVKSLDQIAESIVNGVYG